MLNTLLIAGVIVITFSITGCSDPGCTDPNAKNFSINADEEDGSCVYKSIPVKFVFSHNVNGAAITYNSIKYTSEAQNKYSIETLKYFISDLVFTDIDGNKVEFNDYYYVDGLDETTLAQVSDSLLAAGTYNKVGFTLGFDEEDNTDGRFPNAPESNMEWPTMMGGGYHYMKLEGKYDSLKTGNIKNYTVHTGKTDGNDNHIDYSFEITRFTLEGEDTVTIVLDMIVNSWFESPETYDFSDYDAGIMGNQSAQEKLKSNGADVFNTPSVSIK